MQVVSIEKLGDQLFGCVDDGINYQMFSIEKDEAIRREESFYKSNYPDYSQFVLFYCGERDSGVCFLEEPISLTVSEVDELTYEHLLEVWKSVWCS